jgi:hypothetical protein
MESEFSENRLPREDLRRFFRNSAVGLNRYPFT